MSITQRCDLLVAMPGSIRQRSPTTWQIRVSAGRDPVTGRYRYVSRTVEGGKRDAQRAAAALTQDVDQGVAEPSRSGSLAVSDTGCSRRDGRAAECEALEKPWDASPRGFKSHSLRRSAALFVSVNGPADEALSIICP